MQVLVELTLMVLLTFILYIRKIVAENKGKYEEMNQIIIKILHLTLSNLW